MELDKSHPDLFRQTLTATCREAIRLSLDIAGRLQQGIPAHQLVPLLRQEAQLASQLQSGIRQFGQSSPSPDGGRWRSQMLQQMKELIEQEQQNHRLLSRRGVKLSAPGSHRHRPRRIDR